MVRNLYRFYLYAVFVALLVFAAVTLGMLVQTLLEFTPLRDAYVNIPDRAALLQSVTLAVVSWVIAGALGGLHYWLIRRDMQSDEGAATSAIRSFFLNIPEGIAVLLGVGFIGFGVISNWAHVAAGGFANAFAVALSSLLFALVLEMERRRTQTGSGFALIFRHIHLYGVQFVLLLYVIFSWLSDIRPLVDGLLLSNRGLNELCKSSGGYCPNYNLTGLFITLLWFTACWLAYGWLARNDTSPHLGLIVHLVSFAIGIGFVIGGLYNAVTLLLYPLFHLTMSWQDVSGPAAAHDFFSLLTLGLLIVGVYHFWLQRSARQGVLVQNTLQAIENAITAGLFAVSFWWGIGNLLFHLFQKLAPTNASPNATDWTSAIAFAVAGIAYILLDFLLYRRTLLNPTLVASARRAFVLVLLGAGILASAIGAAVALYAWITTLIGSPLASWQQTAQIGLAGFLVGAILVGIYLPATIRGQLFAGVTKTPAPTTQPVDVSVQHEQPSLESIESILDALLAGKITRDVAAERIRALMDVSTPAK